MEKLKLFFTKLRVKFFPKHDGGTAAFITGLLLTALLCAGIFANDYFVRGNKYTDEALFNVGTVLTFVLLAGATYKFGKLKDTTPE